jgi:hypothetical protein
MTGKIYKTSKGWYLETKNNHYLPVYPKQKIEDLKKERYAIQQAENEMKKRLNSETKPTLVLSMKNKLNILKKEKKLINLKTENAQNNLNIAKSRLRAQRKAG